MYTVLASDNHPHEVTVTPAPIAKHLLIKIGCQACTTTMFSQNMTSTPAFTRDGDYSPSCRKSFGNGE